MDVLARCGVLRARAWPQCPAFPGLPCLILGTPRELRMLPNVHLRDEREGGSGKGELAQVAQLVGGGPGSLPAEHRERHSWDTYLAPQTSARSRAVLWCPRKDGFVRRPWLIEGHMVGGDSLRLIPRSVILEPAVSSPWALSFAVTAGQAVVSDPATWCRIREADLRMTPGPRT